MYSIAIYILLSFIIFILFALFSYKFQFVDVPNDRKIHSKPTAYSGGIAISIILLCALQFFETFNILDRKLNLILSTAFLTSVIGFIDDRYHLNVGGKLSLQIVPIFYLITFESLVINQIGNYNYFQLELGVFKLPFTIISVLFLTNAFNYFDGLDGTLGFTTISVLGILYFLLIDHNFQYLFLIILIPVGVFLFFNFSLFNLPKLFLGDSGSLFLGFIFSFILIYLNNLNIIHPILFAWSIVIFVYEFLAINLIRLINNKDPFKAGKDHLHHLLFKDNRSIFLTNLIISSLNIFLFFLGYMSFELINSLASLILFIFCFIPFLFFRKVYSKKLLNKNS